MPALSAAALLVLPLMLTAPARADLDVAFVLDTTGSMSGELQEARTRVRELAEALQAARPQETIRYGVVAYRDQGDAYVTQVSPLVDRVEVTWRFLGDLSANGGGDAPEDVVEGVRVALTELDWSADADKQIFLIGDAPAHLDYAQAPDLATLVGMARSADVVINAIGCRSLSAGGVEQFRTLAYGTEGQYHHIGRVEADSGGLTEAMLQTLAPEPDDDGPLRPLDVFESRARPTHDLDHPLAGGVIVRLGAWRTPLTREPELPGEACSLTVMLPEGMALADDPAVALGSERLHVRLALQPGAGEHSVWELQQCLPASTAIETTLE